MSSDQIRRDSNKKKLRDELDNLMQGFEETFAGNSIGGNASDMIGKKLDEIAKPAKTYDYDMEEIDRQLKSKAGEMINSMFDFYLDAGIIDKIEYTKRKRDLDTSNLANMLWQLKTVKITISILMDEITSGNTNQKTISALSDMQSRFSDIMKMQASYVLFLEDTYKKMKYEAREAEMSQDSPELPAHEIEKQIADTSDYFLTANPKELIRQITEVSPMSEEEMQDMRSTEEINDYHEIGTANTDPMLKEQLMEDRNIQIDKKQDSAEGYDSILSMI